MPIAQLLELWKKIEVEPMEIEVRGPRREAGALAVPSGLWQIEWDSVEEFSYRVAVGMAEMWMFFLCTWFTYVAM